MSESFIQQSMSKHDQFLHIQLSKTKTYRKLRNGNKKKANKNSFLKFGSHRLACNSFERSYAFLWFLIYRLPENLPPLKLFMLKSAKRRVLMVLKMHKFCFLNKLTVWHWKIHLNQSSYQNTSRAGQTGGPTLIVDGNRLSCHYWCYIFDKVFYKF